jgi:glucose/arabinose dehydrogenase
MRFVPCPLALVLVILVASPLLRAADPADSGKPYGLERRVPWTTSRVVGSPDPPLPYRVRRTFTRLKVPCPIAVAHEPGSDRLLLIHQMSPWNGQAKILRIKDDPDVEQAEELLAVDGIAYGVAFHPDFEKNGFVYVGSNGPLDGKNKTTRVLRYTLARTPPFGLDRKSEKLIIEWASDGHNGGDLAFGRDGMLNVSSGDGTSDSDTNRAGQDLSKLLSKVLRLDVDHPDPGKAYSVPPDNPFVNTPGVRPETWAYGFRNPWRLHIDRETGDLWVGNNGQDLWEQAYLVQRGANYGWSVVEGSHPFYPDRKAGPTPISKPIVEHPHSEMRSLTGGIVYRGTQFPELRGAYLYGDWSTGKIWGVRHEGGRVTWHRELASTTLQITGFGVDSKGELLIADHGGGYYRLEAAPPDAPAMRFPTRLSETGLFTSVQGHQTDPSLIPYSVNAPLWSDGAYKERFLALPGMEQIDFTAGHGWNCPDGTVAVKTFSLDLETGNPASRRRIETRLLTRQQGQWYGYSYVWNDEQTEATLVEAAGVDRVYQIRDPQAPGGRRKQTWHYPSRSECMVCHSRAANWVLGLSTLQMNKMHNYGVVADNQLRTLEHLGVFRVNWLDHLQEAKQRGERAEELLSGAFRLTLPEPRLLGETPAPVRHLVNDLDKMRKRSFAAARSEAFKPVSWLEGWLQQTPIHTTVLPKRSAEYGHLVDPADKRADLDARARSYLHANCAQCHVMAGGGNAAIELEFATERAKTNLLDVRPLHDSFGITDARLIAPGHPERSVLLQRLSHRDKGHMPPLATSEVDREAVDLLREWIAAMKAETTRPAGGE